MNDVFEYKHFVDRAWTQRKTGEIVQVINPANVVNFYTAVMFDPARGIYTIAKGVLRRCIAAFFYATPGKSQA